MEGRRIGRPPGTRKPSTGKSKEKNKRSVSRAKLADREGPLKKSDVTCPICWSILIEPVTLPCQHALCADCWKKHLQTNSLQCPCCRERISVWSRRACKDNNYVDKALWERIQREFPRLVETRILGQDSQYLPSQDMLSILETPKASGSASENCRKRIRLTDENEGQDCGEDNVQQPREREPRTPDSIDLEVNRHFRPIRPEPKTPPKRKADGSLMPEPKVVIATPVKKRPLLPVFIQFDEGRQSQSAHHRSETLEMNVHIRGSEERVQEESGTLENSNKVTEATNFELEDVTTDDDEPQFCGITITPLSKLMEPESGEEDMFAGLDVDEGPSSSVRNDDNGEGECEPPINPGGSQSLIEEENSQDILGDEEVNINLFADEVMPEATPPVATVPEVNLDNESSSAVNAAPIDVLQTDNDISNKAEDEKAQKNDDGQTSQASIAKFKFPESIIAQSSSSQTVPSTSTDSQDIAWLIEEEKKIPTDSQASVDIDFDFYREQAEVLERIKQQLLQEAEDKKLARKLQKEWNKRPSPKRNADADDPYSLRNWLTKKEGASQSSTSTSTSQSQQSTPRYSRKIKQEPTSAPATETRTPTRVPPSATVTSVDVDVVLSSPPKSRPSTRGSTTSYQSATSDTSNCSRVTRSSKRSS